MALAISGVDAVAQTPSSRTFEPGATATATYDSAPIKLAAGTRFGLEAARVHEPGATFVKLHFGRFDLPDGVTVEVSNADGTEVYRYRNGQFDAHTLDRARGDDGRNRFFAMSVTGDTAQVRLLGQLHRFDPSRHGVLVDYWATGSESTLKSKPGSGGEEPVSGLESTCGVDERFDARCYADSHPAAYDRSIPVARVITAYGEVCTAWRVGPTNRMFTVQHCISGQDDLDGAEIWFQYRATSCGSSSTMEPIKVTGGELLAANGTLDYALFTVDNFDSIAHLGHLGLDVRNPGLGEGIFIPQHGLGKPKQIALESDMNASGLCEVDDPDYTGYATGSDIGYFCDTTTSSSGSPVVSQVTGDVIALHHLGGCFNSGSKMSLIWPQVSSFFGGVVPHGDGAVPWGGDGDDPEESNLAPDAHFSVQCDGLECSFDGAGSSDPDGSIASHAWTFGDGSTASGVAVDHAFDAAGTYTVKLTVKDDQGASDAYSKSVTVSVPNLAPKAKLSASCVDNTCQFNGAGSYDPDGDIVSWNWKFGDGQSATGSQASHTYAAAGTYTITLTVKDDTGASDTKSFTTSVKMPNQAPLADFAVSCDGLECAVDATASSDPDGSLAAFTWTFGDGASASGITAQHAYPKAGSYTIVLTVKDNGGASAATSRSVSVSAPQTDPEPEPEPEPEPDPVNAAPKADFSWQCDFERCVFDAGSSTDDGEIVSWNWSFGDGSQASGQRVTHQYASAGRFEVTLTVQDDQGASDGDWAYVDVELADQAPVADFSVNCAERNCTLDAGSSTASESSATRYDWDFGDGTSGEGRTVTHVYANDGVYRVTLKVTDGGTLSDLRTRTVTVESKRNIQLQGIGARRSGQTTAVLTWADARTETVWILRDGNRIAEAANTGKFVDTGAPPSRTAARYQVCETSGSHCSPEILVVLGPATGGKTPMGNDFPGKFKR